MAHRTDPESARAAVAVMDGLCLQALLTDGAYDEERARGVLARVLNEAPRPPLAGSSEPPADPTDT
ncbi:TetR family transcriptional regulator C-terminal domain-containing protein [Streptomyces sp. SP18ES09]|uniref:TetR family transcriptional regulator C-terminal domain-containing protein n=1 Tax=Streptomyces sp. SP18ES09 TaxID=3002532 RepID=UPI003FCC2A44